MKVHELKIEDKHFLKVALGKKTAEIRKNDRDYKVGDILVLKEIEMPKGKLIYTGCYVMAQITHIVTSEEFNGIANGYAMLSFAPLIQATNNVHDCSYYNSKEDEKRDAERQWYDKE